MKLKSFEQFNINESSKTDEARKELSLLKEAMESIVKEYDIPTKVTIERSHLEPNERQVVFDCYSIDITVIFTPFDPELDQRYYTVFDEQFYSTLEEVIINVKKFIPEAIIQGKEKQKKKEEKEEKEKIEKEQRARYSNNSDNDNYYDYRDTNRKMSYQFLSSRRAGGS